MAKKGIRAIKIILSIIIPIAIYFLWLYLEPAGNANDSLKFVQKSDGSGYYFTENFAKQALGFDISIDGRMKDVKPLSSKLPEGYEAKDIIIDAYGYVVVVCEKKGAEDNRIALVKTGEDLILAGQSPEYTIDDEYTVCNVSDEDTYYSISAINERRNQVRAYVISKNAIVNTNDEKAQQNNTKVKVDKAQTISSMMAPGGSIIGDVIYQGGYFKVRTDKDMPLTLGSIDEQAMQAFAAAKPNILQKFVIIGKSAMIGLVLMLIGIAILILIFTFILERSRTLSTISTGMFFIVIGAVIAWFASKRVIEMNYVNQAANEFETRSYAVSRTLVEPLEKLPDTSFGDRFYASEEYAALRETLLNVSRDLISDAGIETYYTAIVSASNDTVLVSSNGRNRGKAATILGPGYYKMTRELEDHISYFSGTIVYNGMFLAVEGYNVEANGNRYYLVSLFGNGEIQINAELSARNTLFWIILISLIGSLYCIFVVLRNQSEIRYIANAIIRVSEGETEYHIPHRVEADRQPIWAGLSEIVKGMKGDRYSRESIYKAYFRFAPKNIENFLRKTSITDVLTGDQSRVEGTLAVFSLEDSENRKKSGDLSKAGEFISYMNENGGSGTIISSASDLSRIDMLFDGSKKNVIELATSLILDMGRQQSERKMSLLLYHSVFWFGITGSNEQALTYLISEDTKIFEQFGQWFASLSIELVITEDVKEREATKAAVRYIGFIVLSGGRKERLYEVLDAAEASERLSKLRFREKFEKTLELFYSRDYYLARNEFSKILQQDPKDDLCRWYLFECEKYLNTGIRTEGTIGALHT